MSHDLGFGPFHDFSGIYNLNFGCYLHSPADICDCYTPGQSKAVSFEEFMRLTEHLAPANTSNPTLSVSTLNINAALSAPLFNLQPSWSGSPVDWINIPPLKNQTRVNEPASSSSPSPSDQPDKDLTTSLTARHDLPPSLVFSAPPFQESLSYTSPFNSQSNTSTYSESPSSVQNWQREPKTLSDESLCFALLTRRDQFHECQFPGCTKQFKRRDRGLCHIRQHLGYKPFICDGGCGRVECREAFWSMAYLRTHRDRKQRSCSKCGAITDSKNMPRHMRSHHQN